MATTRKRSPHSRREGVSEAAILYMRTGEIDGAQPGALDVFLGLADNDDRTALRALWSEVGPGVVANWIKEFPGSRPYAWWLLDCPRATVDRDEPKWWTARLIPARYLFGAAARVGLDYDAAEDSRRGRPYVQPEDGVVSVESETAYLKRLGLLTPDEITRLKPADFEPETFLVDGTTNP